MPTNFPASLDIYSNPTGTDDVSVVLHSTNHANHNDAIEALEAKVGIDGSADPTSHDYKISALQSDSVPYTGAAGAVNLGAHAIRAGSGFIGAGQTDGGTGALFSVATGMYTPGFMWASGGLRLSASNTLVAGDAANSVKLTGEGGLQLITGGGYIRYNSSVGFSVFQSDGASKGLMDIGYLTATAPTAATKAAVFKAAASQTANIVEVQDSAGTFLGGFTSAGTISSFVRSGVPAISITHSYNSDVFSITKGAGFGNVMTVSMASAQSNGFIFTNTELGTYLQGAINYGCSFDVNIKVDNPAVVAGKFYATHSATTAGTYGHLALGIDAKATSSMSGGTYGAAGKFTCGSANVNGVQVSLHASQTAHALAINNSAGTFLCGVDASGKWIGKGTSILAASAVPATVNTGTAEVTLTTVTIPANRMGANGIVRVTTAWSHTSSANNKTLRVKFGGTAFTSGNVTTTATSRVQAQISNRNATNSQVGHSSSVTASFNSSGSAIVTSAVDTTADVTLLITGQPASAGESITLESYLVELITP